MNRFIYIFCVALTIFSCKNTQPTILSIYSDDSIFHNKRIKLISNDSTYFFTLDSTHSGQVALPPDIDSGFAYIQIGKIKVPIYIEDHKGFDLSLQKENNKITCIFSGQGADKNNYLNNKIFSSSIKTHITKDSLIYYLENQERKLNQFLSEHSYEERFIQQEKVRIHYLLYLHIFDYFSCNLANCIPNIFKEEAKYLSIPSYKEFLIRYVKVMSIENKCFLDNITSLQKQINFIAINFKDPSIQEFCIDYFVYKYVESHGIKDLESFKDKYYQYVKDNRKLMFFNTLCNKWKHIAPGNNAIPFSFKNTTDIQISSEEFANKYLYIFYWASWCESCTYEIPYIQKLEERYKGRSINFISISCDSEKKEWSAFIKNKNINGIQLNTGQDHSLESFYQIKTIPRIILIDKAGKIVNSQMPYPSDPLSIQILDTLKL